MDREILDLCGEWKLYYGMEKGGKGEQYRPGMREEWPCVCARVPGIGQAELARAGIEGDPYYDENLLDYAKYEYAQWLYVRPFGACEVRDGERAILRLEGVDTYADIYVNGTKVGSADNMFVAHEFDVTDVLRAENEVAVHIHSAMNVARGKEYPVALRGTARRSEICHMRKAAHTFGWDIAPRLVTAGLWRGVSIVGRRSTRLTETYFAVPELDPARDSAVLEYAYRFVTDADDLEGFSVRITGVCGEARFCEEVPAWFVSGNGEMTVEHPRLWWPKGYGEAALYTVTTELLRFGEVLDHKTERIGLRTVELERSFERDEQKFLFKVNGVPIQAKGTNWVPLDALHDRDGARLEPSFALVAECGCNMVRCWGGGVYESDRFFDLCDENGVMVWQDFCMGNTNYPQDDAFAEIIYKEASSVIRRLRNHAALAVWSGDNEVDHKNMGYRYPHYDARYNRVSRETLPRALQAHDPYRFFVRSSPEVPEGFHLDDVPEQHTWGARAFFKDDFYKHASASFIGEAGYHGCPAPESLREFLAPEHVWPMGNKAWAIHSTEDTRIEPVWNGRNRLMADQVKLLCREETDSLEEFAAISQISQAEALKFFVERTRILKWKRSGILWWNMIDGWPQISDAVVDYFYRKKLAFDYLKRAQRPRLAMLDEVNGWSQRVILANDTREDARFVWSVEDADTGEVLAKGETAVKAGENAVAGEFSVDPSAQKLYLIRYAADGEAGVNHFLGGFPKYAKADLLRWAEVIRREARA